MILLLDIFAEMESTGRDLSVEYSYISVGELLTKLWQFWGLLRSIHPPEKSPREFARKYHAREYFMFYSIINLLYQYCDRWLMIQLCHWKTMNMFSHDALWRYFISIRWLMVELCHTHDKWVHDSWCHYNCYWKTMNMQLQYDDSSSNDYISTVTDIIYDLWPLTIWTWTPWPLTLWCLTSWPFDPLIFNPVTRWPLTL